MDIVRVLKELQNHQKAGNSQAITTGSLSSSDFRERLYSLYISGTSADRDDLVFIVKWLHSEKKEDVEVFRKQSRAFPELDDSSVLWEQSLYLNILMHEFEYRVTCSAITFVEGTNRVDRTLMSISQRVYPSTSKQRMDKRKGRCEMAYPNIMFSFDNFQEIFSELHVSRPGEKISFQLTASNKTCGIAKTIFIGAIDYSSLIDVYKRKAEEEDTLMTKVKRFSSQMLKSSNSRSHTLPTRYYITMAGPKSKGNAEVAIYMKDESMHDPSVRGMEEMTTFSKDGSSSKTHDKETDDRIRGVPEEHAMAENGKRSHSENEEQLANGGDGALSEVSARSSFPLLYANLTYIELLWHSMVQDILSTDDHQDSIT